MEQYPGDGTPAEADASPGGDGLSRLRRIGTRLLRAEMRHGIDAGQGGAMSATKVSEDGAVDRESPYPAPYEPDASVYPDPAVWSVDYREVLDDESVEPALGPTDDDGRPVVDDTDPDYQAALEVLAGLGTSGQA